MVGPVIFFLMIVPVLVVLLVVILLCAGAPLYLSIRPVIMPVSSLFLPITILTALVLSVGVCLVLVQAAVRLVCG